ncbi:MAG: ABC transporter ATP-binding protein [Thermaerobacter sp.]|nr:ABC transporter ATP-binding protein [Thermaerobacter sp.]
MVIHLRAVGYRRGTEAVLKDIDWTVKHGEHWAIIGENGAGKTTLLNIVNGYIWPTTGTVEVLGGRYGEIDIREQRKRIGWVSSSLGQHVTSVRPDETALEVVVSGRYAVIGLWNTPKEEDVTAAREILTAFGGERIAERPFRTLSQGEQQSILLARTWMARAELLILDEPCTGLDLRAREQVLSAIQLLGKREGGPTLVYVTHHVEEILPIVTHALLIKEGRILAAGAKGEVLTSSRLTEAFEIGVDVRWQAGRPWVAVV